MPRKRFPTAGRALDPVPGVAPAVVYFPDGARQ